MNGIFKLLGLGKKRDFTSKVLARYSARAAVSSFARGLFDAEDSNSLNERFAKAKRQVER